MALTVRSAAANPAAAGAGAAISLRGLTKRYRSGALANDGIDLEIPRGVVFALLGPNGAGKTTLVRQITAELTPTSGQIELLGVKVLREPLKAKALMGVVPQEALPYFHLRPREHLAFFGRLHGLSGREASESGGRSAGCAGPQAALRKRLPCSFWGLRRKLLVGIAMMAQPPS
jgi:ABC-2 type transport system ATP-binding protein